MKKGNIDLIVCEFCNKQVKTSSINIPYPDKKTKNKTYLFFPCCHYYKQKKSVEKNNMAQLYQADYFDKQYGSLSMLKRKLFLYAKAYKLKSYIVGKEILEVGSATGEFLDVCRDFHPKSLTGLEISKSAAALAKKRYGFSFVTKNFEDIKSTKRYDTIFMFHVIEHVLNPMDVVKKCLSMLKKNGVLIMETPNVDSWEFNFFNKRWIAWMPYEHTYLFSTKTFKQLTGILPNMVKKTSYEFSPISNVLPVQVADNKIIMRLYPLFLILYTLIYYISYLAGKSGIVTAIYSTK